MRPSVRRTRIVATIGPASRSPEALDALLRAGVDVCRLNCSHGDAATLRADVAAVRAAARRVDREVAILLDLQGPKIRTGALREPLVLEAGDRLTMVMDPQLVGAGRQVGTTWPALADELSPGDRVLFSDGALEARVEQVHRDLQPPRVVLRFLSGGSLGSLKGINLPDLALSGAPCLTPKDLRDLEAGLEAGVDCVALSFVRRGADIDALRARLAELGHGELPICAKIEKPQAIDDLDAILQRVEVLMVARGDLGVEIPFQRVPIVQKQLIGAANRAGVLVITATQMLESMIGASRPTRAEATDVANAILDGSDAVMLSGETAVGAWPVRAVEVMDRLAREAEQSPFFRLPPLAELPHMPGIGSTVARAACYAVREDPRPLVVFTYSGYSAITASKSRPPREVFAMTPRAATVPRLALAWGVTPVLVPLSEGTAEMIQLAEEALLQRGWASPGDEIVFLAGKTHERGSTNMMTVERLGA